MIFGTKKKCGGCGERSEKKYSFCPACGNNFIGKNEEKEKSDYGLLGEDDSFEMETNQSPNLGFGLTDRLIGSVINSMMKNLDKQFRNQLRDIDKNFDKTEIRNFPNGIKIRISGPFEAEQKAKKQKVLPLQQIDASQIKRMNSLPREEAKTNVKRLGNKIIYELATHGVSSAQDIFVSKLESGYEIKAIGSKKVYVNNVPINLPLTKYSILKNKLLIEFSDTER